MNVWIDGDACPNPIKQIIFKAVQKRAIPAFFVANRFIDLPHSVYIKRIIVPQGPDKSDEYILSTLSPGDLIVSADIIFADLALSQGALVLNPNGILYTPNSIKEALSIRNFHHSLREFGLQSFQAPPLGAKEIQRFSSHFDRILNQLQHTQTPKGSL